MENTAIGYSYRRLWSRSLSLSFPDDFPDERSLLLLLSRLRCFDFSFSLSLSLLLVLDRLRSRSLSFNEVRAFFFLNSSTLFSMSTFDRPSSSNSVRYSNTATSSMRFLCRSSSVSPGVGASSSSKSPLEEDLFPSRRPLSSSLDVLRSGLLLSSSLPSSSSSHLAEDLDGPLSLSSRSSSELPLGEASLLSSFSLSSSSSSSIVHRDLGSSAFFLLGDSSVQAPLCAPSPREWLWRARSFCLSA
mmetsp:Transcript_24277/g.33424  ORF Transcript_24277/g.33424 Transcript_24277/m.33424 type:complete len:245 (+) Transcript_24277:65-799(+)